MPEQQQARMFDGLPNSNASMLANCIAIIQGYPSDRSLTESERSRILASLGDSIIRGRYRESESSHFIRLTGVGCHSGMRAIDCFVVYEQEGHGGSPSTEYRLPLVFFFELHHFMYLDGASL